MKTLFIILCITLYACASQKPAVKVVHTDEIGKSYEMRELDFQGALMFVDSLHQVEREKFIWIIDSLKKANEKIPELEHQLFIIKNGKDEKPG